MNIKHLEGWTIAAAEADRTEGGNIVLMLTNRKGDRASLCVWAQLTPAFDHEIAWEFNYLTKVQDDDQTRLYQDRQRGEAGAGQPGEDQTDP